MGITNLLSSSLFLGVSALAAASCGGLFEPGSSHTTCGCPDGLTCVDEGVLGTQCEKVDAPAPATPGPGDPASPSSPRPGDAGVPPVDAGPPPEPAAGSYAAPCPNAPPALGSTCSNQDSPYCVYGDNVDEVCDQTFRCGGGDPRFNTPDTWYRDGTFDYACSSPGPGDAKTICPSDFSAVAQGASCTSPNLFCPYAQGLCACTEGPGGGGPTHPPQWVCAPPPKAATPSGTCPTSPPRTGMACSAIQRECDYGSCSIGYAPVMVCSQGVGGQYSWFGSHPTQKCL